MPGFSSIVPLAIAAFLWRDAHIPLEKSTLLVLSNRSLRTSPTTAGCRLEPESFETGIQSPTGSARGIGRKPHLHNRCSRAATTFETRGPVRRAELLASSCATPRSATGEARTGTPPEGSGLVDPWWESPHRNAVVSRESFPFGSRTVPRSYRPSSDVRLIFGTISELVRIGPTAARGTRPTASTGRDGTAEPTPPEPTAPIFPQIAPHELCRQAPATDRSAISSSVSAVGIASGRSNGSSRPSSEVLRRATPWAPIRGGSGPG